MRVQNTRKVYKTVCTTAVIPSEVWAFMLLKRSGATQLKRTLVMSRFDFTKKDVYQHGQRVDTDSGGRSQIWSGS